MFNNSSASSPHFFYIKAYVSTVDLPIRLFLHQLIPNQILTDIFNSSKILLSLYTTQQQQQQQLYIFADCFVWQFSFLHISRCCFSLSQCAANCCTNSGFFSACARNNIVGLCCFSISCILIASP
jgi:hypothetical protein